MGSWELWKLAHAYPRIGSGTTPPSTGDHFYSRGDGNGLPWVTTAELRENYIETTESRVTEEALKTYSALRVYAPRSLMIAMYGATIGRLGITTTEAACNQACCVFEESKQFNNRFLFYWLWHRRNDLIALSVGGGQPNLSQQDLKQERALCPPIETQQRIAQFLDEKTARIDALIEKKRALLDRLAEKRQALITHAVTKGLNTDAPMRPSGVQWLGDIPEHWEIIRMKNLGTIRYGLGEPPAPDVEGIPFIRATDIYRGSVNLSDTRRVSREDIPWKRNPELKRGEILVVRSGAYTGDSALVTESLEGFIAGYDMVLHPEKTNSEFLSFVLLSHFMLNVQIHLAKQRAAQPHLNAEELGSFYLATPPKTEQAKIADFLGRSLRQIRKVEEKIEHSAKQLFNYRASMIAEAVRGQITGLS